MAPSAGIMLLLSDRRRDATWQMAVFVGAHVRTRRSLPWFFFVVVVMSSSSSSSTLMVLVLPVPGGPQIRLNLLPVAPLLHCTAETQLSMAPACESLSPNAASLPDSSASQVPLVSRRGRAPVR